MTEGPLEPDPLEALSPILGTLSREVDQLRALSRGLRSRIRLLALSFVLFVILAVSLGTVFWRVERVNNTAVAARAATVYFCAKDNIQNAETLRLWTYILSELPMISVTQRETSVSYLEGLTDIYSQVDCPT